MKNRNKLYTGKVGAKMKPRNYPVGRGPIKSPMHCIDGPMAGVTLYVGSPSTMLMKYKGQTGRYVGGKWEAV